VTSQQLALLLQAWLGQVAGLIPPRWHRLLRPAAVLVLILAVALLIFLLP
jgi:hypothetical protein